MIKVGKISRISETDKRGVKLCKVDILRINRSDQGGKN